MSESELNLIHKCLQFKLCPVCTYAMIKISLNEFQDETTLINNLSAKYNIPHEEFNQSLQSTCIHCFNSLRDDYIKDIIDRLYQYISNIVHSKPVFTLIQPPVLDLFRVSVRSCLFDVDLRYSGLKFASLESVLVNRLEQFLDARNGSTTVSLHCNIYQTHINSYYIHVVIFTVLYYSTNTILYTFIYYRPPMRR